MFALEVLTGVRAGWALVVPALLLRESIGALTDWPLQAASINRHSGIRSILECIKGISCISVAKIEKGNNGQYGYQPAKTFNIDP